MNHILIVSGGIGSRMKSGSVPKQYMEASGKPIIAYCLMTFEMHPMADTITIVADPKWYDFLSAVIAREGISKFRGFAPAGETRQLSILNGLESLRPDAADGDVVSIHDAVRPCVSEQIITDALTGFPEWDGVMPYLPVTDTCYLSYGGQMIEEEIPRDALVAGQTPESFLFGKYYAAHIEAGPENLRELRGSTQIAVRSGMRIRLVPGSRDNFKITTREDFDAFLNKLKGGCKLFESAST
ncbi:MAG: IspD/TarI family cytidylyltransferase [Lachnospiraceae bacterium]|nr:IspD/TarI family cytidylyltransferase [Lachnospiraceae bacterium]